MAALVKWVGPSLMMVAPWAYAPRVLPGLLLVGPAAAGIWLGDARLKWMGLVSLMVWFGPVLEYRLNAAPRRAPSGQTLRVITCNRGQHNGHSLAPWVKRKDADVVLLQDAFFAGAWKPGDPGFADLPHVRRMGEHVILSRHEILSAERVSRETIHRRGSEWWYEPAARFVIDFQGTAVVVWSVHVRSPREHFRQLRDTLAWWLGWMPLDERGVSPPPPGGGIEQIRRFWPEHRMTVECLLELFRKETLPVVVAGDWNVPDAGPLHRQMTRSLTDVHRAAGTGCGHTFPGDLKWWPAFNEPWLRIDYILCDRQWEARRCEVERDCEGAQHLALFAELELRR